MLVGSSLSVLSPPQSIRPTHLIFLHAGLIFANIYPAVFVVITNLLSFSMNHEDNNLVRFAAYELEYEAVLMKNALIDNGIEAWVTGGDGVNIFGAGLTASGLVAVDVRIRQKDLEKARALVSQIEKELHALPTPSWNCKCGEAVDEGFAICWSCGADFDDRKNDI